MNEIFHIISLGAGVQSSAMSLMAAVGEITPMPHCAVFADTGSEPPAVYKWLDWLEAQLPFKVHRVMKVNLASMALKVRKAKSGNFYTQYGIPAFILNQEGKVGIAQRQCTEKSKLDAIYQQYNKIRSRRLKQRVIQWVGISYDEWMRMKPARRTWVQNRYPLVDGKITRKHCLEWMKSRKFPEPPRSACIFCPYHNDDEWRRLKDEDPESFTKAAEWEKLYQHSMSQTTLMRGVPFLHRSLTPLAEIDFSKPESEQQINLFQNECEGMCGV